MKKTVFLMLAGLVIGNTLQAGSMECTGLLNNTLKYRYWQNDGGAFMRPTEDLSIDGKVLLKRNSFEIQPEIYLATFRLKGEPKELLKFKTDNNNYVVTTFVSRGVVREVTDHGPNAVLFDDVVVCRQSNYVGMPRP